MRLRNGWASARRCRCSSRVRVTSSEIRPSAWRLLFGADSHSVAAEAGCGAFNMAVDHALFEGVQRGNAAVLRFYRWQPACLSLGRNQAARLRRSHLQALAPDVVRRPTGGLAVLHDQELTYSVAVPVGLIGSPRATYHAINRALLVGLQQLGVPAEAFTADSTRQTFQTSGSCFAGTAPGEVGVDSHKLIGSAQRCERRTLLQHGSILLDGDQSDALVWLDGQVRPNMATALRRVLGELPGETELLTALCNGFERELGVDFVRAGLDPGERSRIDELTEYYSASEWTWRV